MTGPTLTRREILNLLAGATTVAAFPVSLAGCGPAQTTNKPTDFLYWVMINADNSVTCTIPQTEIGQGVTTTIAQLLAEELDVDWSAVRTRFYDPNVNLDNENMYVWTTTLGSMSAHYLFEPARIAGAQIRSMMLEAATERFKTSLDNLRADKGFVHNTLSSESLSYAELAEAAAALSLPNPSSLQLKPRDQWELIGQPIRRLDAEGSSRGGLEYGIDLEMPGMRYASVRQSPVLGGTLVSVSEGDLLGLSGNPTLVRLKGAHVGYNSPVPEGEDPDLWATPVMTSDAVAVVADTWWEAESALRALQIEWDPGTHGSSSSASLEAALRARLAGDLGFSKQRGDVDKALESAGETHTAEYVYPFMEPAPLEPLNCTALVDGGRAEVWSASQYADDAVRIVSDVTGLPRTNVRFNLVPAGGGFGRRGQNDFVFQAVQLAVAMQGVPVKLLWSREECTRKAFYAPLTIAQYRGALGAQGQVSAWVCRVASTEGGDQAYGASELPFQFPNSLIEYDRSTPSPAPFGWMRGVGYTQHVWMNFGFLDELCVAAGRDAADVYEELLRESAIPPDHENRDIAVQRSATLRAVLKETLQSVRWRETQPSVGSGRGLAVSDSEYYAGYGSSSAKAAVVKVTLLRDRVVRIDEVFIAIDCGTVINPDIVTAQLEGGVAYALTNAFMSEITIKDGAVEQSNFHDYPILKMDAMPKVTVQIMESDGLPLSVGEDSVPITIAALVNAIADAGGPRIRRLPMDLRLTAG